jgi:hypothetical protein
MLARVRSFKTMTEASTKVKQLAAERPQSAAM